MKRVQFYVRQGGHCPGNQEKSGKEKKAKIVKEKSGNLRLKRNVREKSGNLDRFSERESFTIH